MSTKLRRSSAEKTRELILNYNSEDIEDFLDCYHDLSEQAQLDIAVIVEDIRISMQAEFLARGRGMKGFGPAAAIDLFYKLFRDGHIGERNGH